MAAGKFCLLILTALFSCGFTNSIFFDSSVEKNNDADPCIHSKSKISQICVPDFVNAAFGVTAKTNSTCGNSSYNPFCFHGKKGCHICDDKLKMTYPAKYLTDLHNPNNETCWHSKKLTKEKVNTIITIPLQKKYELTYISMHFCHLIPTQIIIQKSMDHGMTWQPFQYYSTNCQENFGKSSDIIITKANEQEALCHRPEKSAKRIAFSTLAERPSAETFERSPVLQDWVTATDIRIIFPTQNSDNESENWIGISDISIGGRCKCNGHASKCMVNRNNEAESKCLCKHNTAGKECEKCKGK